MHDFIRKIYSSFVLIGFFVFLIVFIIGGGIIGKSFSGYRNDYTAIGVIIGLIVGFVIDVLIFGFISTIINIDENLDRQNKYFRLFLKSQNIKVPKELEEAEGMEKLKVSTNVEQKKCNDCGNMVNLNVKQCPSCGSRDFSQI